MSRNMTCNVMHAVSQLIPHKQFTDLLNVSMLNIWTTEPIEACPLLMREVEVVLRPGALARPAVGP